MADVAGTEPTVDQTVAEVLAVGEPGHERRRLHEDLALLAQRYFVAVRAGDPQTHAFVRLADRAEVGGLELPGVLALQPTISPPISVWPQQLSTVTPKRSRNRRACSGDSGAVMLRT